MAEANGKATKRCSKCERRRPRACFYRKSAYKDGIDYWCKDCCRESRAAWGRRNRDRESEYSHRKQQRNPEGSRRRVAQYRERHPDRVRDGIKQWRENHPDAYRSDKRIQSSRRRARKLALPNERIDPVEVYVRSDGVCGICGESVTIDEFQIDHIIPLAKGGAHLYSNVQASHAVCNRAKSDKLVVVNG